MSSISGHEQVPQRIRRPRKVGARLDLRMTLLSNRKIMIFFLSLISVQKYLVWCSLSQCFLIGPVKQIFLA